MYYLYVVVVFIVGYVCEVFCCLVGLLYWFG